MNIVESRNVREVLSFRAKSLRACGMPEIASLIEIDIATIMRDEQHIYVSNPREELSERIWRVREHN